MAVKVLIERTARPGMEKAIPDLLRQLRAEAMHQRGYIYGETWRSLQDPESFLVVSTWSSLDYWQAWEKDPFRQKMETKMEGLLARKPTIRIYEEYFEASGVLQGDR